LRRRNCAFWERMGEAENGSSIRGKNKKKKLRATLTEFKENRREISTEKSRLSTAQRKFHRDWGPVEKNGGEHLGLDGRKGKGKKKRVVYGKRKGTRPSLSKKTRARGSINIKRGEKSDED